MDVQFIVRAVTLLCGLRLAGTECTYSIAVFFNKKFDMSLTTGPSKDCLLQPLTSVVTGGTVNRTKY